MGSTYASNSSNLSQTLPPVLFLIFVPCESKFLKKIKGFFFLDFHALWSPAMETERQNRSEWQAKLGWRRDGFPPSHCWTDLH